MISRFKLTAAVLAVVFAISTSGPAFAGAVSGPMRGSDRIAGDSSRFFKVSFWGGEIATVAVVGKGYTDLDLYIYDSYGNEVTSDEGAGDWCSVRWFPRYKETYIIKVVNRGLASNEYGIATN